jgi:cytoskeletal protein CcmA (bactofilin family)
MIRRRPTPETPVDRMPDNDTPDAQPASPRSPQSDYLTIPHGLELTGDVSANTNLRVEGAVRGRIDLGGHDVAIEPRARVQADVRARNLVVRGCFEGSIEAEDRVVITARGKFSGNVRARRFVLAEGATFNGGVNHAPEASEALPDMPTVHVPEAIAAPLPQAVFVPRLVSDEPAAGRERAHSRPVSMWTLVEGKAEH